MKARTLLVAHDNSFVCDFIRERVESSRVRVLPAADGEEVLRVARERKPDAILLDLTDGLTGLSVLTRLRQESGTREIPVMVVGLPSEREARRAASIGAHRSLAKPFRAEHLVSCVEELLAAPSAS